MFKRTRKSVRQFYFQLSRQSVLVLCSGVYFIWRDSICSIIHQKPFPWGHTFIIRTSKCNLSALLPLHFFFDHKKPYYRKFRQKGQEVILNYIAYMCMRFIFNFLLDKVFLVFLNLFIYRFEARCKNFEYPNFQFRVNVFLPLCL